MCTVRCDHECAGFRIFAGGTEFGGLEEDRSRRDREYLSAKIDDPSFSAPLYASLVWLTATTNSF